MKANKRIQHSGNYKRNLYLLVQKKKKKLHVQHF